MASVSKSLEEQKENCPFCGIVSGKIPSKKVFEDKHVFCVLDKKPANNGHLLVIPKKHVPVTPLLEVEALESLAIASKNLSNKLLKAFKVQGTSLFVANGGVAGQMMPHSVFHLIPRSEGDSVSLNPVFKELDVSAEKEMVGKVLGQSEEGDVLARDDDITILCPSSTLVKGMLSIFPNEEYVIMEQVPDDLLVKMFQVANKLSGSLFEALNCEGTNLLIQNGVSAGQTSSVFSINIIPRYSEDGLDLSWSGKDSQPKDLEENLELLHGVDKKEKQEAFESEQKEKLEEEPEEEEVEDYLARSLRRLP